MVDRLLRLAGDDDDALSAARLRAFRQFLLLYGATRSWLWLHFDASIGALVLGPCAVALSVCALLAFIPRTECWATRLAAPVLAVQLYWTLPFTDNHFFLECVALALLCFAERSRPQADALILAGLRWTTVLVLFHTGLSKLLYGQYFHGDFLAYMIGTGDRFGDAFRLLLGADEVVRLQGYDALHTGAGPFRVSSWPFVLASNLVWIAELALPVLLMVRRTRAPAALGSIALVLAIQAGARELGFAMLFGNLLLLFLPGVWNRRLLPLCALAFVLALLAVLGWLPGGGWLEAGYL